MAESDPVTSAVHIATLSKIFRPSAPTDDRQLFRGRGDQLDAVSTAILELGQHAIVFGERGVGKTSLAYMAMAVFKVQYPSGIAMRIPCDAEDDFQSVWRKLVGRLRHEEDVADAETRMVLRQLIDRIEDMFLEDPAPELVSRALQLVASRTPILIVLDEFDRMNVFQSGAAFADLVKQLSDDLVDCTLCLVGVADNVADLIAAHASIDRSLRQIVMPRMTQDELSEIVKRGFETFSARSGYSLNLQDGAIRAVSNLSQGFPYYTHLLASAIGKIAIVNELSEITFNEVFMALMTAKDDAEQSIQDSYHNATVAGRADATYELTLLACAMAKTDHRGFFAASDVRQPLADVYGAPRKNSDFNNHLRRFSAPDVNVLEAKPVKSRWRYRFSNPLMKPFVLMRGFASGHLKREMLLED